jgi:c-di-GMP-binding flagellar brake protein YcgR
MTSMVARKQPGLFPVEHMSGGEWVQINPISETEAMAPCFGQYIGCLPDLSLLIALPESGNKTAIYLQKDQLLNVRIAKHGGTYTFQSTVLCVCNYPSRYFHMAYPKSADHMDFRKWPRVSVFLSGTAMGWNDFSDGTRTAQVNIVNISMGGALIESQCQLGGIGDELRLAVELEAGGIKRDIDISCVIRTTKIREDKSSQQAFAQHGVQFEPMENIDDTDKIFLYGYVCEQLLRAKTNKLV